MPDPSAVVAGEAELEQVVGRRPGAIMLKSIGSLDEHCERLLACSPFAMVGTTTAEGSLTTIALGGEPGFLAPRSEAVLELGDLAGRQLVDGAPAGLIALVPGYGETLRINGRIRVEGGAVTLDVEEALLHCAKAIMRSGLWIEPAAEPSTTPVDEGSPSLGVFLAGAPFVVLASTDGDGHADVSPRGDPPGLVRQLDEATIAIADRPGNHRTDTLHNLVADPRVALLALRPGSDEVAEVRGAARVCTDRALLESMRIRNRTPKVAILIDVEHGEVRTAPALAAADLWNPSRHVAEDALPRAATIWADHVRRNTDPSTGAKVARRLVSERALAAGVALDYRRNL